MYNSDPPFLFNVYSVFFNSTFLEGKCDFVDPSIICVLLLLDNLDKSFDDKSDVLDNFVGSNFSVSYPIIFLPLFSSSFFYIQLIRYQNVL